MPDLFLIRRVEWRGDILYFHVSSGGCHFNRLTAISMFVCIHTCMYSSVFSTKAKDLKCGTNVFMSFIEI